MGESDTPSVRLGTDILSVRLGEEALPKTLEGIIARLFTVVGLVAGGMPVAWGASTGSAGAIRSLAAAQRLALYLVTQLTAPAFFSSTDFAC